MSTPLDCELPSIYEFFLSIQVRMARLDWSWEPAYLRDIVGQTTKKQNKDKGVLTGSADGPLLGSTLSSCRAAFHSPRIAAEVAWPRPQPWDDSSRGGRDQGPPCGGSTLCLVCFLLLSPSFSLSGRGGGALSQPASHLVTES